MLLDAGADVNCQNDDGWTPLYYAVKNNNVDIVQMLLNKSRCDLSKKGSYYYMELEHEINSVTALHIAAAEGYDDCVKMLLDAGADVNCQDDDGRTPLHYAAENNNADIVQMLLNNSRCDCALNIKANNYITQQSFEVNGEYYIDL
nr:putative ankyrin repeat protein RF_0381 [Cherax quadricarinatus]